MSPANENGRWGDAAFVPPAILASMHPSIRPLTIATLIIEVTAERAGVRFGTDPKTFSFDDKLSSGKRSPDYAYLVRFRQNMI